MISSIYTAQSQKLNIFITCDITFMRRSYHMVYHTHVKPYHIIYQKGVIYHFLGEITISAPSKCDRPAEAAGAGGISVAAAATVRASCRRHWHADGRGDGVGERDRESLERERESLERKRERASRERDSKIEQERERAR
jgi:hypothetical protein